MLSFLHPQQDILDVSGNQMKSLVFIECCDIKTKFSKDFEIMAYHFVKASGAKSLQHSATKTVINDDKCMIEPMTCRAFDVTQQLC
jgi:hypothetical protein